MVSGGVAVTVGGVEQGFVVLTEKYHLDKGFCCGNGCKHCPYEYEAVPEPTRSELIEKKK